MSTNLPKTGIVLLGTILLFAILTAGCAGSPYGPTPTKTAVTTAPANPPPATAETTVVTTATTVPATATTTAVQTTALPITVTVTIQNYTFIPASVTVPAGSTVTWTNLDAAAHQVVSDTQIFRGYPLSQGSSYTYTFKTRGVFPYYCGVHTSMKGTIIVT